MTRTSLQEASFWARPLSMIPRSTCPKMRRIKASRHSTHANSNQTCPSSKLRQAQKKGIINRKCRTCKTLMKKPRVHPLNQCQNHNQSKWRIHFKKRSKRKLKLKTERMIRRKSVLELGETKSSQLRIRKIPKRFTLRVSIHLLLIREAALILRRTVHQIHSLESAWTKIMVLHYMTELAIFLKDQATSAIFRRRVVSWKGLLLK